jgi:hypothetical protein
VIERLWRWVRQQDDLDALQDMLEEKIRSERAMTEFTAGLRQELELERVKRIGAEALAGERVREIDRLEEMLTHARESVDRVMGERLKSLDALNVRLMEPRVEVPAPDMTQFRREVAAGMAEDVLQGVRTLHRKMDMAIVEKFARPKGGLRAEAPAGPVVNEPVEKGA